MKRFLLLALLLGLCFASCRRDFETVTTTTELYTPPLVKVESSVYGRVVNESGNAVVGATVQLGTAIRVTGEGGFFSFKGLLMNKNGAFVKVTQPGYFHGSHRFLTQLNAKKQIEITLIQKTDVQELLATVGGTVVFNGGAKVVLPANGFVTEAGLPYLGQVKVTGRWLDPTLPQTLKTMPGNLFGINSENKEKVLQTFGMLAVELTSATGAKLNLAPDAQAELTFPLPSASAATAPAMIPLWYFDEINGVWREEGMAEKVGNSYVGKVNHFTFWNCDAGFDYVTLSGKVVSAAGAPMSNLKLAVTSQNYGVGYNYSSEDGSFEGLVPSGEVLLLSAYSSCGNLVYSATVGPFSANQALGNIIIPENDSTYTLRVYGTLLDCSGQPVTEGYVQLGDGFSYTNNVGAFDFNTSLCGTGANLFEYVVLYNYNEGNFVGENYAVFSNTINVETVTIEDCLPEAEESLSFDVDTFNFNFTENLYSTQPTDSSTLFSWNPSGEDSLIIIFPGSAIGTYSLTENSAFYGNVTQTPNSAIAFSCLNCSDVQVLITAYGALGETIEGTFSGTMDNVTYTQNEIPLQLPSQFVTGSFKVIRQ